MEGVELLEELEDIIIGENGEVKKPPARGAAAAEMVGHLYHVYKTSSAGAFCFIFIFFHFQFMVFPHAAFLTALKYFLLRVCIV